MIHIRYYCPRCKAQGRVTVRNRRVGESLEEWLLGIVARNVTESHGLVSLLCEGSLDVGILVNGDGSTVGHDPEEVIEEAGR